MKKFLLSLAIMMIAFTTTFAQVPTVMMYQVQIKHGKAAAQDVSVEMQLRTSQNGNAVWHQTFELKDVKNGSVQNLGLDFGSKVDLGTGEYWLATIVDGEEKGCAKLTSVPYAMVAKKLEGVLTAEELVGTWKQKVVQRDKNDYEVIEYAFNFKSDGSFTYYYHVEREGSLLDSEEAGEGNWEVMSNGNLYYHIKGTERDSYEEYSFEEEKVVPAYLNREAGKLVLGGGDNFYGDHVVLMKGESSNDKDNDNIDKGEVKSEFIGKWTGTITEDGETVPGTLVCNSDGTYEMSPEVEGVNSFSGKWSADGNKLYLTGFFEEYCYYTINGNELKLNGTGWTGSFTKSATR